jgi:ABC-2 type transport system permease protein
VVQWFTYLVPARYYMVVARSVFLKGSGLADLWPEVLTLGSMGVAYLLCSILAFRKRL